MESSYEANREFSLVGHGIASYGCVSKYLKTKWGRV